MEHKRENLLEAGSPERFGYSWNVYDQLLPEHREQFLRWTQALPPEYWRDKSVLDVGCGMGRNSYWAVSLGAASVTSIDVDTRSLNAAKRNLEQIPNVQVNEMSAYDIPQSKTFDITFSIGVIHHLGEPETALQRMRGATKDGGKVLIWVYGLENNEWIVKFFNPLRKALFSRLPINIVYHLSLYPSILLWLFLRLGLGRIEYLKLLRKFSFQHLRAIVFDQMLPKIAHYWSRQEVEELMMRAGLRDIKIVWVNEMSWSAVGVA